MFEYVTAEQADQFSFIRIPRVIMTDDHFSSLSTTAKVLYGLMLDRMGLSSRNDWIDENGYVYVMYPLKEIEADLGVSRRTASDAVSELEDFGLLEKKVRAEDFPVFCTSRTSRRNPREDQEVQNLHFLSLKRKEGKRWAA